MKINLKREIFRIYKFLITKIILNNNNEYKGGV